MQVVKKATGPFFKRFVDRELNMSEFIGRSLCVLVCGSEYKVYP